MGSVFLGFGIFRANRAFSFGQFTGFDVQGWQCAHRGYLSPTGWLHALAIYAHLLELPVDAALGHLKHTLRGQYRRLYREFEIRPDWRERLRAVEPGDADRS